MNKKLCLAIGAIAVATVAILLAQQVTPEQRQNDGLALKVTITPKSPTTYEQTAITIKIKNTQALGGTPEIEDETRGLRRAILWSHPVDDWQGTYTLPQLFPKEGLPPENQISIRVTIKNREGEKTTVRKSVTFKR